MTDLATVPRRCHVGDLAIVLRDWSGYHPEDVGRIVRIIKRAPGPTFDHEGWHYMECGPDEWLTHSPDGFDHPSASVRPINFRLFPQADLQPIRGIEQALRQGHEEEADSPA